VEARIQSLAGTVAVDSRPGAGTCWRFSFPGEAIGPQPAEVSDRTGARYGELPGIDS